MNDLAPDPSCAAHVARLRRKLTRWRHDLADTREQGRIFWSAFDADPP